MVNPKDIFHKISYLQYPIMLIGMYYAVKPYVVGFETIWENYNYLLIFMGLGISLSTLQDTSKTQNKVSKRIWENPKKGKRLLIIISFSSFFLVILGLYGMLLSANEALKELSFGVLVLGIGIISLLKSAAEMFENHRLDRNNKL